MDNLQFANVSENLRNLKLQVGKKKFNHEKTKVTYETDLNEQSYHDV